MSGTMHDAGDDLARLLKETGLTALELLTLVRSAGLVSPTMLRILVATAADAENPTGTPGELLAALAERGVMISKETVRRDLDVLAGESKADQDSDGNGTNSYA